MANFFVIERNPKKRRTTGMDSVLGFKYPSGSIVNLVGIPKSGKTRLMVSEAMNQSRKNKDVLYIFNESPKERFVEIVQKYAAGSKENILFYDLHNKTLRSAQYSSIEKFVNIFITQAVEQFLRSYSDPTLIIFDSLSKMCRTYPAQAYYFVQAFTGQLWSLMSRLNKYPVVICVNQKSGGYWERNDETVLGGYGILHDFDGSIVLRLHYIDRFKIKQFKLPLGSILHTLQIVELRGEALDTDERILELDSGNLKLGRKLSDYYIIEGENVSKNTKTNA